MGYLLHQDRNIGGKKVEFETISCPHCQQVAAIHKKGCSKSVKFNNWCGRCCKPICRGCAAIMQKLGNCPGPFIAIVEASMQAGRNLPDHVHQYR